MAHASPTQHDQNLHGNATTASRDEDLLHVGVTHKRALIGQHHPERDRMKEELSRLAEAAIMKNIAQSRTENKMPKAPTNSRHQPFSGHGIDNSQQNNSSPTQYGWDRHGLGVEQALSKNAVQEWWKDKGIQQPWTAPAARQSERALDLGKVLRQLDDKLPR